METNIIEKAYYILDGDIVEGRYCDGLFRPNDTSCGYAVLMIVPEDFGKTIFFERKLAEIVLSKNGYGKYQVSLKFDVGQPIIKEVEASSAKDALDAVADTLCGENSSFVYDIDDISATYQNQGLAYGFAKCGAVRCGSGNNLYLSVLNVVKVENMDAPKIKTNGCIAMDRIHNPFSYLACMTGHYYNCSCIRNGYVDDDIKRLLWANDVYGIESFALSDIEKAIAAGRQVVLVDCSFYRGDNHINEYRWFQIDEHFNPDCE